MHATLLFHCLQSDTRPAADTEMMMVITMITRHFLALLQTPSYLSCSDGLPLCKICKIWLVAELKLVCLSVCACAKKTMKWYCVKCEDIVDKYHIKVWQMAQCRQCNAMCGEYCPVSRPSPAKTLPGHRELFPKESSTPAQHWPLYSAHCTLYTVQHLICTPAYCWGTSNYTFAPTWCQRSA